jgi:hypothetical protein
MPDARPDRHRTKPGYPPDAACFLVVCFSLRRRRKGWCLVAICFFRRAPAPIFQSHFFLAGSNTGAEREPGQGRAFSSAFIGAQRRPLTRLPRSVHSLRKKWDHRLPSPPGFSRASRCGFFRAACASIASATLRNFSTSARSISACIFSVVSSPGFCAT